MPAGRDSRAIRKLKSCAVFPEDIDRVGDAFLLFGCQAVPQASNSSVKSASTMVQI
jgi:hypothetical protein